jgi:hypothetical protein
MNEERHLLGRTIALGMNPERHLLRRSNARVKHTAQQVLLLGPLDR